MILELTEGVYADPVDVTDINIGPGVVWVNRRNGLRGIRVLCHHGEEQGEAARIAERINGALGEAA